MLRSDGLHKRVILKIGMGMLVFLFFLMNLNPLYASNKDAEMREYYEQSMDRDYEIAKIVVKEITYDDTNEIREDVPLEADIRYQHLKVEILDGKHRSEVMSIRHTVELIMPGNYIYKVGDKMIIRYTEDDNGEIQTVRIEERLRSNYVYIMIFLFMAILLGVGRKNGLKSLISLVVMVGMILFLYIPGIIKGYNPVLLSISISSVSIAIALVIISGFNKKSLVAILGTIGGVVVAGILAMIFGNLSMLTGLDNENSMALAYIPHFRGLNYKGILFGTIIIGSIGAVMDVAISIASSMWEIYDLNRDIERKQLIKSGMNIGRDIMGSMSNTLILAYISTSLHLVILFKIYRITFVEIMNYDSVAAEVLRAMAGSVGLIFTIPLTVLISAQLYYKNK